MWAIYISACTVNRMATLSAKSSIRRILIACGIPPQEFATKEKKD